jgi:di/tricarboxylate transporter
MNLEQLFVLGVVILVIIILYKEWFRPVVVFLMAIAIFAGFGILKPEDAIAGFSNSKIVTIILLLIVSNVIRKAAVIDILFNKLFNKRFTYWGFLGRLMPFTSIISAFMNNTPLVATFMPYIHDWGKKYKIAPSKLLIPLGFAAILGGMSTMIGTSTHLITSGFVEQAGLPPLSIFDFTVVGLPMAVIGVLYILFVGYRLLPERQDAIDDFAAESRNYIAETIVKQDSPLHGKTVGEADLKQLKSLYLAEIIRDKVKITPVSSQEILLEGDILIFAGDTDTIAELIKTRKGLKVHNIEDILEGDTKIDLVETVIPNNSLLIGKTVKESNFTDRFDASIIGVHRNGEKISGKIGSFRLAAGDLLLMITGKSFANKRTAGEFYVFSEKHEIRNLDVYKALWSLGGLVTVILASVFLGFALFKGLLVLIASMILFRVTNLEDIKSSIDLELFAVLGFALAFGSAFIESGTADIIAQSLIAVTIPLGTIGVMVGLFALSNLLAGLMNSAAALSVVFPISIATASALGIDPLPFVLLTSFGAAANFITPFGYATNLLVYGYGGYEFKDFSKIGTPLVIIYMIGTIGILGYVYGLIAF